jgi:alpha-galactosidase
MHASKITLAFFMLLSAVGFAQTYEFETGTLANNANVQTCDACSGSIVGNLGGDGSVSLPVTVAAAGWYNLQLFYCTGDPRTIKLTPGSGATIAIPCEPSGGWSTAVSKNISVYLNAGATTTLWDNTSSWAPNLDKFVITPLSAPSLQTVSFGTNNSIVYDLTNKTYDIKFNGVTVVSHASAYAYGNQQNTSGGYSTATYTSETFTDAIGSGTKHIFTLTGGFNTNMQQVFYAYDDKDYVAVQVVLTGSGANCYKMSPLTSSMVTPNFGTGDTRAVFVPYDNDAWVRYNAQPLTSADFTGSEVTNIYNNTNRNGLVIGSVDHTHWKTGITVAGGGSASASVSVIAGYTLQGLTRDTRGHGWVNVGQTTCASPKILISADADWRTGFETFAQANAAMQPKYVFDWTAPKPLGWNSWGAMQTNINLTKVNDVVDFFDTDCAAFRTEDNTLYIDLDSYWDNMTDAQLAQFVTYAQSKGFKAGIYWAPFVDWGKWDRPVEGSAYNYAQCWTMVNGSPFELDGAYAMDPTHPGTKDRIAYFVDRFKAAGFEMVKIDFLAHAAIEADGFNNNNLHTGMEAYREGMEFLIDELNGEFLVYAAISPNMATGPYAHMRRIACDSYKTIDETNYSLNSTTYGWWQNQMYDYIDADHVVFGDVSEGQNRARLASSIVTGTVITGDDFSIAGPYVARAQTLLQNDAVMDVARAEMHFMPAEGNTSNNASPVFYATHNDTTYVAVFNYSNATATNNIDFERIGLGSGSYTVKELYLNDEFTASGSLTAELPAADAALYAIYTETTMGTGKPAALSTSYIYPNPTNGELVSIKFATALSGDVSLKITGLGGKQIWTGTTNVQGNYSPQINLGGLAKGFYLLTATTQNNTAQTFKLVKQ